MNWELVEGDWVHFKNRVKARWTNLTHKQLDLIAGRRVELAGAVQVAYGMSNQQAEDEIRRFEECNKDYRPTLAR